MPRMFTDDQIDSILKQTGGGQPLQQPAQQEPQQLDEVDQILYDLEQDELKRKQMLAGQDQRTEHPSDRGPSIQEKARDIFTGELRMPKSTQELPRLGSGAEGIEGVSDTLKVAWANLFAHNPTAIANAYLKAVPGAKTEEDEQGNIIVVSPTGKKYVAYKPGMDLADLGSFVAETGLYAPAGGLASATGRTLFRKALIEGIGAGLTSYGKQKLTEAAGTGQSVDPFGVALDTALGFTTRAAGEGLQYYRAGREAKKLGGVHRLEVDEALENFAKSTEAEEYLAGKYGLPKYLDLPQRTGSRKALQFKETLSSTPGGAAVAQAHDEMQDKILKKIRRRVVGDISTTKGARLAGPKTRKVARDIIRSEENALRRAAKVRYGKVLTKENPSVRTAGLFEGLETNWLDDFGPEAPEYKTLKRLTDSILPDESGAEKTLKELHGVRKRLNRQIGRSGIDKEYRRSLIEVKAQLDDAISAASPEYMRATRWYAGRAQAIDELKESVIGRIEGTKLARLDSIRGMTFNPESPLSSSYALRKIHARNPQVLDDLLRLELETRLSAIKNIDQATPTNFVNAIFGTGKKEDVLLKAAKMSSPEHYKNLVYLKRTLQDAAKGRVGGSRTFAHFENLESMLSTMGLLERGVRDVRGTFANFIHTEARDIRVKEVLTEMLDPNNAARIASIRRAKDLVGKRHAWKNFLRDILTARELKGDMIIATRSRMMAQEPEQQE